MPKGTKTILGAFSHELEGHGISAAVWLAAYRPKTSPYRRAEAPTSRASLRGSVVILGRHSQRFLGGLPQPVQKKQAPQKTRGAYYLAFLAADSSTITGRSKRAIIATTAAPFHNSTLKSRRHCLSARFP